jgi:hypothetical protein
VHVTEPAHKPRGGVTPLRIAIWVIGAAIGIALIATGIVGILTKAR